MRLMPGSEVWDFFLSSALFLEQLSWFVAQYSGVLYILGLLSVKIINFLDAGASVDELTIWHVGTYEAWAGRENSWSLKQLVWY